MPAWTHLPAYLRTLAANSRGGVLLETARFDEGNRYSHLFLHPVETIEARSLDEIPRLFERLEHALAQGRYLAGYLSYECGEQFALARGQRLQSEVSRDALPLAWFGVYERPFVFDHVAGGFVGEAPHSDVVVEAVPERAVEDAAPKLEIAERAYVQAIETIKRYIEAGDTYQVNFTDAVTVRLPHSAAASFGALMEAQPVSYGALLHVEEKHILSLSPELFFSVDAGAVRRIMTRPMKGTMPRGMDVAEDAAQGARLAADEKNRSEHIMIVDLLRNDLGRICRMGTVRADELFRVERYRTLLQMTSTVEGVLRDGLDWYEIFQAVFPSGSITGAPKIRTMEIIRELERGSRGVYTGGIGYIAPTGAAAFNVAIRTLVVENGVGRMGVGGGIVADSEPEAEYRECQLKTRFLTTPRHEFQLIETMLAAGGDVKMLPLHMERLADSAAYFDFVFDRAAVEKQVAAYVCGLPDAARYRVRLLLHASGVVTFSHSVLAEEEARDVAVKISDKCVNSKDVFLRHKTTLRALYDEEFAKARAEGFDEVLFVNERGELTEGAISTVFLRCEGRLLTPPLESGVLPGVLRRQVLATEPAEECVFRVEDIENAEVYIGNSVRGLRRVTRIEMAEASAINALQNTVRHRAPGNLDS